MIRIQDAKRSMIRSLRLQNYKCFEMQFLDLNFLTLLSGLNGTGKSSVIQAFLLLRQSFQQNVLALVVSLKPPISWCVKEGNLVRQVNTQRSFLLLLVKNLLEVVF